MYKYSAHVMNVTSRAYKRTFMYQCTKSDASTGNLGKCCDQIFGKPVRDLKRPSSGYVLNVVIRTTDGYGFEKCKDTLYQLRGNLRSFTCIVARLRSLPPTHRNFEVFLITFVCATLVLVSAIVPLVLSLF